MTPDPSPYDAVLLVSFGGPERPEDVVPFLENVTRGRGIPRERLEEVGEHYYLFGGRSPINDLNRAFIAAIEEDFAGAGLDLPVYWGNRNWAPYLPDALAALRADGVPCALVTMSYERLTKQLLEEVPARTFDVVVTGDNVAHGKPHPEPYLHAARLLGVDPGGCVAIEDSQPGAASAEAAGCRVLVVENHVSVPPGPGRVFLPTLSGLTTADIAALRVPRDRTPSPPS